MNTQEQTWVGRSIRRKEDHRLLIGDGRYVADMTLPRMLIAAFVRSPHANARIIHIDASRALTMAGIIEFKPGKDLEHLGPVLSDLSIPRLPGETKRPVFWPLPVNEVTYVGDLVAVVIGRDKYVVEDVVHAVAVEYDVREAVLDPEIALLPDSPRVYSDWDDNVVYHQHFSGGDIEQAFASADLVVSQRFRSARSGASPMEPRASIAEYSAAEGLTVWLTTQRSHIKRHLLAEYFKIPDSKIRVIAPKDVGGGFGVKAPLYREDIVLCHLSMCLKRPVKWVENRQENLVNIGQERDQIHDIELALRKDGKILGIRDRMVADCGSAQVPIYVSFSMPWLGAMYLTNGYDIPNIDIDLYCVVTHKPGLTPSRSFGSFTCRFAIDRIVDIAARRLKIDPVEIRRKNAIKKYPHTLATGVHCDSGDFPGALDKACHAIDYERFRKEQQAARGEGRYLGIGFSLGIEFSGLSSQILVPMERQPGFGVATVRFDANGNVQVAHGDQPQGQGHDTTIAQVVADELGLTPDDIYVISGDTQSAPFAAGTLASRMGGYTLSAAVLAARGLRPKLAAIAAHHLGISAGEDEFVFRDGEVMLAADPTQRVAVARIAETAMLAPTELPPGMDGGLENTAHFEADTTGMHSTNVHVVTVEVFPNTGDCQILRYIAVDDCGRPVNPTMVRGQIHGGVALGIGNACQEEFVYDEAGNPLVTTLTDYLMVSARDLPHIEVINHDNPSPHTPLGTKGKGEGPTGMVPGALGNAIEDALSPFGVTIAELPMTKERIWTLIDEASR